LTDSEESRQEQYRKERQVEYWNRASTSKGFHHPVDLPLLNSLAGREELVVELGCGRGRVLAALAEDGYSRLCGFDPSPVMIECGALENSGFELYPWSGRQVALESGCASAVLLFAVLTCVPGDDGQRELIAEAVRLLRPGGVLYVSDYFLQSDARNTGRYEQYAAQHGTYGVFEIEGGAVLRHLSRQWYGELTAGFEQVSLKEIELLTMNGNPAVAFQYAGRLKS
jgi:SAM-dependent methyltransferase